MGKRGISTLISVMLLIVLVIGLFVIVFSFSRKSVESGFEKGEEIFEGFSSCDEVKYRVEDAFCDDENFPGLVFVKVNNEKNIDFLDAFSLRVFYEEGVSVGEGVKVEDEEEVGSFLYDTRLLAYEVKDIAFGREEVGEAPFTSYRPIREIEIVPKVKAGESYSFCQGKKQKIRVRECTN